MRFIINKKLKRHLFFAAYRSFQIWYVLYRLLREVFRWVMVILNKFHNSAFKITRKKKIHKELSDVNLSKWFKHIPQEIVELILHRLPLDDYLRFGTVCSSWRSAVAKVIAKKCCSPKPEFPSLMFCAHPYTNREYCFLSLSTKKVFYKPNGPELQWRHCAGSVEGWLILSDSITWRPEGFIDFCRMSPMGFLNPVSGARIMLPSQTTLPLPQSSEPWLFYMMVASEVPTSPNCVTVAVFLRGQLAFCRPVDNSWILYENNEQFWFTDIIFHDGQLYAISLKTTDFVAVLDFRDFSQGRKSCPVTKILTMLPPRPIKSSTRRVEGDTTYHYNVALFNLVKDRISGNLLMSKRICDAATYDESFVIPMWEDFKNPPRIKAFQVFKWDQKSGPRWEQVHSLGDRIVFLSRRNCIILSAASIWERKNCLKSNCIYFALDYTCTASPQQGRDIGVFCLNHRYIERNLPSVPRSWLTLNPFWFTSNPW